MKRMLNNLKHYKKEDLTKVKVSSKVNYLLFVSIAMKLVTLLLDVQKGKITEVVTSTKIEEKVIARITKIKARSHTTFLKKK